MEFFMAKKKNESMAPAENKKKKLSPPTALTLGIILLIVGIVLTPISISSRVKEIGALETLNDKAYFRKGAVVDSKYNGHPVFTSGELTYEAPGATDTVFGVTADSAMLFRVSEMAQWNTVDGEVKLVWSEEIIPSPDASHENPEKYPSNSKSNYYTAISVSVGDYSVSEEQLFLIEEKAALETLPSVDVRGFKTVGGYITNSENLDNPKVGDVRIRYEYIDADVVTLAGKQREAVIVSHTNFDDVPFFAALVGEYTRAEVIDYFRDNSAGIVWWLLLIAVISLLIGAVLLFDGFTALTKYSPTLSEFGKKAEELDKKTVTLIYAVVFALVIFAVTYAISWAGVYPIWLVVVLFAAFIYFYVLISDIVKNMPKRVKKEAEYVPILVKREDRQNRR